MFVKAYYKCSLYESMEARGWGRRAEVAKKKKQTHGGNDREDTMTKVKKDVEIEGERSNEGGKKVIITVCMT